MIEDAVGDAPMMMVHVPSSVGLYEQEWVEPLGRVPLEEPFSPEDLLALDRLAEERFPSAETVLANGQKFQRLIAEIHQEMRDKDEAERTRWIRVQYALLAVFQYAETRRLATLVRDPLMDPALSGTYSTRRFAFPDLNEAAAGDGRSHQRLLTLLYFRLAESGYRRKDEQCWQMIRNARGQGVHAWEPVMSISEFVARECSYDVNQTAWNLSTTDKGNHSYVVESLNRQAVGCFPVLVPDRHVFAFENGVYDAGAQRFMAFEDNAIAPSVVACNFFPGVHFDPAWLVCAEPLHDIPTPNIDLIFNSQDIEDEVRLAIYMMAGRCLYEVGELDRWELMLFLLGPAGTGKSSFIDHVVRRFYHPDDVGALGNNIEERFGLDPLADKLLVIATEIKGDFRLDPACWQQMVSGETMSVARKNLRAQTRRWRVPLCVAGNELPAWTDKGGSVVRRMLLVAFSKQIRVKDATLTRRLHAEVPAFLVKANRIYRACVANYEGLQEAARVARQPATDFRSMLPKYFDDTSLRLRCDTNPVDAFIHDSSYVVLHEEAYAQEADVRKAFRTWCEESGRRPMAWNRSLWEVSFDSEGVKLCVNEARTWPPGPAGVVITTNWFTGLSTCPDLFTEERIAERRAEAGAAAADPLAGLGRV